MAFADTDEERMSYYEIIKSNNQLLMQLINDILDLSKIEADAIKISYAPIDLNEMMDNTYASIKLRMPKGVDLILEKGLEQCTFGTDQIRLLQLINNLANNAIKNTKQGSITMGYKDLGDGRLNFYVKDTGLGIAEDKLQSLFKRLYGRYRSWPGDLQKFSNQNGWFDPSRVEIGGRFDFLVHSTYPRLVIIYFHNSACIFPYTSRFL